MSPENQWLEDVFPIELIPFLGDMLVFGSVFYKRVVIAECPPTILVNHLSLRGGPGFLADSTGCVMSPFTTRKSFQR